MMAQFGGQKNPPWARAAEMPGQGLVTGLGQQPVNALLSQAPNQQTVYSLQPQQPQLQQQHFTTQQLQAVNVQQQLQPQQQNAVLPQPGIAIPTTLATSQVATVSYPTPRVAQQQQQKQRVFTGTVSKLHDNFGFVDEDVFFQTSCVKGQQPKVGDRVLVEATYNANMPFKWNATRIQVLPNQQGGPGMDRGFNMPPDRMHQGPPTWGPAPGSHKSGFGPGSGLLKPPGMAMGPSSLNQQPPPLMGQPAQPVGGPRQNVAPSRRPDVGFRDRGGDRGGDRGPRDRGGDRHREERRERRSPRKRSRSPRRSRSPTSRTRSPVRRRPARIVPRYMVQIPKLSLDMAESNVMSLRSRYQNLYVPSDFFKASCLWTEGFPLHRTFQLGHSCSFHVMNKEVQPTEPNPAVYEPSDADHLYSAKVMLLSCPPTEDMYHKSCALAEDPAELKDNFQHPTRLLHFLVGLKGKSEPMAIGGPWSPSLDGPNPGTDPAVLIKTAIRTTRALTGIDLSSCTQWYRFAEIRYHRGEETHKGRLVPARVESVVLFLPDVWSCNPTRLEWDGLTARYKKQLAEKLATENKDDQQEEEEEGEADIEKKDPTHHSELDPKTMKVNDLRRELECRTLSTKGLKSQLIARLTKAIKSELEKEEQEAEQEKEEEEQKLAEEAEKPEVEDKEAEQQKKEEEERKRREERDRAARERRYQLPDNPAVIVHPSTTAKSGKFDCSLMSLSILLDYRPEDNKEHSFEVSLFAELFNEMLMRDFGFRIYKALVNAPEKKEEKKDKEKGKDKEKSRDSKEKEKDKEKEGDEKDKDKEKDKKEEKTDKKKDKDEEKEKDTKKEKDSKTKEKKEEKEEEKEEKEEKEKEDEEPTNKKRKTSEKEKEDEEEEEEDKDDEEDEAEEVETTKSVEKEEKKKSKDKDKDKKREKTKYLTFDPDLLLSFVYFDQTHTGYVLDKDLEELMHTLGLQLSRAQVKKLVQKVVHRDTLNYRKLTDKPEPKKPDDDKVKEDKTKETKETKDENGDVKMEVDDTKADIKLKISDEELAKGNRPLIAVQIGSPSVKEEKKRTRTSGGADLAQGFVTYNGGLVDITSIMQRLEKSEKTRTTAEIMLRDSQQELEELKSSLSSSEQNSQKVALELQDLKKKLREQKKSTDSSETIAKKYQEVLNKSRGTLSTLVSDMDGILTPSPPSSRSSDSKVKTEAEVKTEVNGDS